MQMQIVQRTYVLPLGYGLGLHGIGSNGAAFNYTQSRSSPTSYTIRAHNRRYRLRY